MMLEYAVLGVSLLNLGLLLYWFMRAPLVMSLPFALALAQKEAELMVLRQTISEARNAFAAMKTQQERERAMAVTEQAKDAR